MRAGYAIAIAGAAAVFLAIGRPFAEVTGLEGQLELSTEDLLEGGRLTALRIAAAGAALAAVAGMVRPVPRLPLGAVVAAFGAIAGSIAIAQLVDPLLLYDELAVDPARRSGAVLAAAGAAAILAGGLAAWAPAALAGGSEPTESRAPFGRILAALGALVLLGSLFLRWSTMGPAGWDEGTTLATALFLATVAAALAHLLWSVAGGEELGVDATIGLFGAAAAVTVSQVIMRAPEGFGGASAAEWLALGSAAAVAAGGYVEWRRPA